VLFAAPGLPEGGNSEQDDGHAKLLESVPLGKHLPIVALCEL
jgi:hypothetical protein